MVPAITCPGTYGRNKPVKEVGDDFQKFWASATHIELTTSENQTLYFHLQSSKRQHRKSHSPANQIQGTD